MASTEDDLPLATIVRILKNKLSEDELFRGSSKDSRLATTKAATAFMKLLANVANSFCVEDKRMTVLPKDIFKAIEALNMSEFVPELKKLETDIDKSLESEREKRKKIAAKRKAKQEEIEKEKDKKQRKLDDIIFHSPAGEPEPIDNIIIALSADQS